MSELEKLHKQYTDYKTEHGTIGLQLSRLLDNGFHHARREHQDMEVELAELREAKRRLEKLVKLLEDGAYDIEPLQRIQAKHVKIIAQVEARLRWPKDKSLLEAIDVALED